MTKQKFDENFKSLLVHLRDVTELVCFNALSENYVFIVEPSDRNLSDHLTEEENGFLLNWNRIQRKELPFDQVVALLYQGGKVPKWCDCFIYRSTPEKTVVKIKFSRQFRNDDAIYYLEGGTAPFKALVQTNSEYKPGEKFDVNWKADLDRKESNWLYKLKTSFGIANQAS